MRIAVFGLGKLGLPLAAIYAAAGHDVIGIDPLVDFDMAGKNSTEPGLEELLDEYTWKHLSLRVELFQEPIDLYLVIVPTPSFASGQYDIQYVKSALTHISRNIISTNSHPTIAIISTVNPGDTGGVLQDHVNGIVGRHVCMVYSPEFIALGNVIEGMTNPDFVMVGCNADDDPSVYVDAVKSVLIKQTPIRRLNTTEAEIAKIGLNSYITMKITFANAIAGICEEVPGTSAWNVLGAIGEDSRVGKAYLKPGGPYCGPCFPRDNRALALFAEESQANSGLPIKIDELNINWYHHLRQRASAIARTHGLRRISILGLTYKPNTIVTDESIGKFLADQFYQFFCETITWDPLVECTQITAEECIGPDILTVIANPDPRWADLGYAHAGAVLDIWGILPEGLYTNVYRTGEAL